VRALGRIHPDPAWAIVSLYEKLGRRAAHPHPRKRAPVELAPLSPRGALIVVDPRTIRSVPGMSVVPMAAGRAFLAFEEGRGLADLELAVLERLQDSKASDVARQELSRIHRRIRDWRRLRRYRFSRRSIILVERTDRAPRIRRRTRRS
jgi:hypothetical protein